MRDTTLARRQLVRDPGRASFSASPAAPSDAPTPVRRLNPLPAPSRTLVRWLIERLAREEHPGSQAAREHLRRWLVAALAGSPRQFRMRLRQTTTPDDLQLLVELASWHEALAREMRARVSLTSADAAAAGEQHTALAVQYRSAAQLLALIEEVPLPADSIGGGDRT